MTYFIQCRGSNRRCVFLALGNKVPVVFKLGVSFINSLAFTGNIANVAAGWLFDQAVSSVDSVSTGLENVSPFIADGGVLTNQERIARRGADRFLVATIQYDVAVGRENRSSVLYGCVYPVNVVVSQFATTGAGNNKIVKPISGTRWGVWDVEGSTWDDQNLTFDHQDADYYYFKQDEFDNGQVSGTSLVRISTSGGAYQKKKSYAQSYATFYANVVAN